MINFILELITNTFALIMTTIGLREKMVKVIPSGRTYNKKIAKSIRNAKKSIYIHFRMLRPSEGNAYPRLINDAIEERVKEGDINIYILTTKEYDRIAGAFELKKILIDNNIHFSSKLHTDLSYTLIDEKKAIIGINKDQTTRPDYSPSDTWIEINSITLCEILEKNYREVLEESVSYDEYLTQVVLNYTDGKRKNIATAARDLKIPVEEISHFFKSR